MESLHTQSHQPVSSINVTPLVDVMLVLLVIFLISAPILYQNTIKIRLPAAQTATADTTTPLPLEVTITKKGALFLNRKPTTWNALEHALQTLPNPRPTAAVIQADQDTTHGTVIRTIDLFRKYHVLDFSLSVRKF